MVAIVASTCLIVTPAAAAPGDEDPVAVRARQSGIADLAPKRLTPAPKLAPETIALMTTQDKLDAVAERIEKAARDTPTSGLGGIVVDAKAKTLHLAWHGPRPVAIDSEVTAAGRAGLKVRVTSAPYTRSTLRRETDRLAEQYMKTTDSAVRSVGPNADGSGLTVGVVAQDGSLATSPPSITSSVPLEFTTIAPEKVDRWYDSDPYWGGSLLLRYPSSSTGWPDYTGAIRRHG